MSTFTQELESTECPICFETLEPPSRQCYNGHLVCNVCVLKITHCPVCREKMPDIPIRNLFVDKMLEGLERSCKNNGCGLKMKYSEIKTHQLECLFRTLPYCKWMGIPGCSDKTSRTTAKRHFDNCHRFGSLTGTKVEVKYHIPVSADVTTRMEPIVLFETDHFFVLKCEVTLHTISWFVLSSFTQQEQKDFLINLELVNADNKESRTLNLKDYATPLCVEDDTSCKPILELPLSLCYRYGMKMEPPIYDGLYHSGRQLIERQHIMIWLNFFVQDLRFEKPGLEEEPIKALSSFPWRKGPP